MPRKNYKQKTLDYPFHETDILGGAKTLANSISDRILPVLNIDVGSAGGAVVDTDSAIFNTRGSPNTDNMVRG